MRPIDEIRKLVGRCRDAANWKPVKGSPETHLAMLQSELKAVANKLESELGHLEVPEAELHAEAANFEHRGKE